MARPAKRYRIGVRGRQRDDIDADLLLQALLIMAEDEQRHAGTDGQPGGGELPGRVTERPA